MIKDIKKLLKGPSKLELFYLSSEFSFCSDSSYTFFRTDIQPCLDKDCLFISRKLLKELSTIIKAKTILEVTPFNIEIRGNSSIKKYPLLSKKDSSDLLSFYQNLPLISSKGISLELIPEWSEIVEEIKELKTLSGIEGLLVNITKENIVFSTPQGVWSSFTFKIPISLTDYEEGSYTCNKEILLLLKEMKKIHLIFNQRNSWIILEKETERYYFPVKTSTSYHKLYTDFDPLSFLS